MAGAQPRSVRFSRLSLADGLPAASVYQSLQDRDGFVWLATSEGLSRFDGNEFVTYRHDPADPTSLAHNHVWCLLQTSDGVLWVGTDGGGLSRFDGPEDGFTHFRHDPEVASSLGVDRVRVLLEGSGETLWVGTDGGGLSRLDRAAAAFEHFRHREDDPTTLPSDKVRDLIRDRAGSLWVATDGGGLAVLDDASESFSRHRHDSADPASLDSDRVRRVFEDSQGTIWVGTYDQGLERYDGATRSFERLDLIPDEASPAGVEVITAIAEDRSSTLWIGTDSGLFRRLRHEGAIARYQHDAADPRSLNHDEVLSLFEDRGNVLWVGTRSGLATWNTGTGSFLHYLRTSADPEQLSDNYVNSFAEGRDGEIWVGTLKGLNRFDRATGRFRQFLPEASDPRSLSDDGVMSLLVDRRGVLWVGTRGGLNRFDAARGTFDRFLSDRDDPATLSNDGITSLIEDHLGFLWVGTYGGGLNRLDPVTGRFERFRHDDDDPASLSSDRVTSIHEDGEHALWIGTDDAGLNRFDRESGGFTHYRHDPANPQSLSGDDTYLVSGDSSGNLWVGTRASGLNRWSGGDRRQDRPIFHRYTTADGLASSGVWGIVDDGRGDLWVSTTAGLSRLNLEVGTFTNYNETHGLQSDEFNFGAAFRARDGELYFGGVNGFNRFRPEHVRSNPHVPPIVLTDFLKFNQSVDLGRPLTKVEEIELGFRESVIAFEFAALDYTAPEKNRYMYMLEGFDRDWVDAGTLRHAAYTNLDPGSYVFRVKGSNNDGLWNEEGIAISIHAAPPPWGSWWAYTLYALAIGGSVALTSRTLARRRKRAEELLIINDSLEREIETRRAKEKALEEEKLKAREYLDVAEVIMVALDDSGEVRLVNQKGCVLLGYEEDEIVGSDWLDKFVPPDRQDEVRGILARIDDYPYCEYPLVTHEGEERVIAWHSTRLPTVEGASPVILSSGTDNTEVRKLERQVRIQQKMDALGTLAGGIAHDFNNILTAILGFSTMTLNRLPPDSEESDFMGHVVSGCERARDMVARILTFSRSEDPDRRPIEIGPVVQEACELLRSSLPPNIEIRTEIDPDCPAVTADPTQIHQVIMNLGTNSGHAMPDGGRLEVTVEMIEVESGSHGLAGELKPGPYAQITVADSGHGIDQAAIDKIFDPFYTTKQVGAGTGLGLSVAHGIIKSHEGDISVRSSTQEGTAVVVRLPCSSEGAEFGADESAAAPGGVERILLVDDERPIVLLASKWLEGLGYAVEGHTDGVEALAAFEADPQTFDLIVTDQSMPGIEGLELVRQARQVSAQLPAVLTSGRHFPRESADMDCIWLQKPFTANELAESVRLALGDLTTQVPLTG